MKVYISGPITGVSNAREIFAEAQEKLEAKGYEVVNPFDVGDDLPQDTDWADFMIADLKALKECQGIYFLPRWQMSPGANIEKIFALRIGLTEVHL